MDTGPKARERWLRKSRHDDAMKRLAAAAAALAIVRYWSEIREGLASFWEHESEPLP